MKCCLFLVVVVLLLVACGGGGSAGGYDVICYSKVGDVILEDHYDTAYVDRNGATVMFNDLGILSEDQVVTTADCVIREVDG